MKYLLIIGVLKFPYAASRGGLFSFGGLRCDEERLYDTEKCNLQ